MDQVYEILIHKVHDYEGTVNELTGDGIMALFGAPIALEDAPQRAVRSSIAIHRNLAKLNEKLLLKKRDIPPLKMRIGIHTGPVVVGTVGNDLRVEFKAVGDTVNLASRVESIAEPGTTLITENTLRLTEGLFSVESIGERKVKGREESVIIYRVIAPSSSKTRFDASAERGLTPFIGRERELELLLDCFERSKEERGQAVSIVAEAGNGKSRLLYEFRKAIISGNVRFFEGKCLSYSRGVAYNPIKDILKSGFKIRENDDGFRITEKIKNGLEVLKIAPETTLPYLLDLLSVKGGSIEQIQVSPDERKERIKETFNKIILKNAELKPLVIAIEDLHWIDKSSEDTIKDTLDSIAGTKVLLILTYRPEFISSWRARSYYSQISLNRLSNRETMLMASYVLNNERIGKDLEELILKKTEGIPFFLEEFIKALKDLKLLHIKNGEFCLSETIQQINIPSTIHDIVMARVDSLPDGPKEVLQAGSAIEREFSYEVIKRVAGLPEQELLSYISILKTMELLYERGIVPHSIYIFKHALIQDVVYESILTTKKKQLHEAIGITIEVLSKETIDTQYGTLAKHFIQAENYEKGAKYSNLATREAQKKSAFKDAIGHAQNNILCLERLPQTKENVQKLIDVRTVLARYCMSLNFHIEAKDAVLPIVALAEEIDYQKRLSGIYVAIGSYYMYVDEDVSKGINYLDKSITISQSTGNMIDFWMATFFNGVGMFSIGEYDKGFKLLKRAEDLSKASGNQSGIVFIRSIIYIYECFSGYNIGKTYKSSKDNLNRAEEIGDIFFREPANVCYGIVCFHKRMLAEAESHLKNALALCEKTEHFNLGAMSSSYLAEVYLEREEYENAQDYIKKAISFVEPNKYQPSIINNLKLKLFRAKILNNEVDINLNEMMKTYSKITLKDWQNLAMIDLGQILINVDDRQFDEAQDWIEKAISIYEGNNRLWHLAMAYVQYADLFKRKDDRSNCKENLTKAIEYFERCGADGWMEKYEREFAEL